MDVRSPSFDSEVTQARILMLRFISCPDKKPCRIFRLKPLSAKRYAFPQSYITPEENRTRLLTCPIPPKAKCACRIESSFQQDGKRRPEQTGFLKTIQYSRRSFSLFFWTKR